MPQEFDSRTRYPLPPVVAEGSPALTDPGYSSIVPACEWVSAGGPVRGGLADPPVHGHGGVGERLGGRGDPDEEAHLPRLCRDWAPLEGCGAAYHGRTTEQRG